MRSFDHASEIAVCMTGDFAACLATSLTAADRHRALTCPKAFRRPIPQSGDDHVLCERSRTRSGPLDKTPRRSTSCATELAGNAQIDVRRAHGGGPLSEQCRLHCNQAEDASASASLLDRASIAVPHPATAVDFVWSVWEPPVSAKGLQGVRRVCIEPHRFLQSRSLRRLILVHRRGRRGHPEFEARRTTATVSTEVILQLGLRP